MATSAAYNVANGSAGTGSNQHVLTVGTCATGSGSAVPATDTIFVICADGLNEPPSSIIDSAGNVYNAQVTPGAGTQRVHIWSSPGGNALVTSPTADTITITWPSSTGNKIAFVKAASGIASATVDQLNSSSGSTSTPSSNLTPGLLAQASELAFGGIRNGSGQTLSAPSFGTIASVTLSAVLNEFDVVTTSTAKIGASGTLSGAVAWGATVGTFKISLPTISTNASLPNGTSGSAYSQSLTTAGGLPTYTYAVTGGSLTSSGLALSSAGVLSGTAGTAGTYNFTATVTDGNGNTNNKAFTVIITGSGFANVQNGTAASGTGSVVCGMPAASTIKNLLVAVVEAAAAGPFTAPAGWLRAGSSGGSSVTAGERNHSFDSLTGAGVTGLTTAISYASTGVLGATGGTITLGIPQHWPSAIFQPDVVTQIMDYQPDITNTLNGSLDSAHIAFWVGAPAGSWIMPYHEPGVQNVATAASTKQLDIYLIALKNRNNPGIRYGRGYATGASNTTFVEAGYAYTSTSASPAVFTVAGNVFTPGGVLGSGGTAGSGDGCSVILTGSAPTGFSTNKVYYVVNSSGSTFNLAATIGGAAIAATSVGSGTIVPVMDFYGMDGYQHSTQGSVTPTVRFGGFYNAITAANPLAKIAIIETMTALAEPPGVTNWFNGIVTFVAASPNMFNVNTYWGLPPNVGAGSQFWSNIYAPVEQSLVNALAAIGGNDVEIWYYPNNPGSINNVTFTGPAGVLCRGGMSEFSSPAGTTQALDAPAGVSSGSTPSTSIGPTATSVANAAGDLGVLGLGAWYTGTPGGAWTSPSGWSRASSNAAGSSLFDFEYKTGLAAGVQSATATYSISTGQNSWGGVLATFKAIFSGPSITTTSPLPQGTVGQPYVASSMAETAGVSPFTWSAGSGHPPGVTLSSSGAWSGTATTAGTYTFNITVTDVNGSQNTKSFTIVINPAVSILTATLPNGVVGTAYVAPAVPNLQASGGTLPLTWTTTSGAVPAGTSYNSSTGAWSGTPTTATTYNFTLTVTDANGSTASKAYTVIVAPGGPPPPPPNPTYFPASVIGLLVELNIGGTWTDITDYVYGGDRATVTITGGTTQEGQTPQPAQCQMTLNNRDGSFSPDNTAGQFYPNIQQGIQIRVSINATSSTGVTYSGYRFWGAVAEWPPQSDTSAQDIYVAITANGPLRQVNQGTGRGGALYRYYQNLLQTASQYAPVAYWPCEENPSATVIGSGIDAGTDMSVSSASGNLPIFKANNNFNGAIAIALPNKTTWDGVTGQFGSSGDDIFTQSGTWIASTTTVEVAVFGGGGGATKGQEGSGGGNGGGGAAYAQEETLAVTPGKQYLITVGEGGAQGSWDTGGEDGGDSSIIGDLVTVLAHGGKGAKPNGGSGAHAAGGTAGSNFIAFAGGQGGINSGNLNSGAAGGGSAGSGGNGGAGSNSVPGANSLGGAAGVANSSNDPAGAKGGFGGYQVPGQSGRLPGAGGGGGWATQTSGQHSLGGNGAPGSVELSYTPSDKGTPPPWNILRFVMQTPSWGGTPNAVMLRMFTAGTITKYDILYISPGKIQVKGYTGAGGTSLNFTSSNLTIGDNQPVMVSLEATNNGANIKCVLKAISPGASANIGSVTNTITSAAIGNVSEVLVSPNADVTKTAFGHITVQYQFVPLANVSQAMNGNYGEMGIDRFIRMCGEQALGHAEEFEEQSEHWGFESGTQNWSGTNANLSTSALVIPNNFPISGAWPAQGEQSLQITSVATGAFSAISPNTTATAQNVNPGDIVSVAADLLAPNAGGINNGYVGVQFYTATGATAGAVQTGSSLNISQNVPVTATVRAMAPTSPVAAFFAVIVGNSDTLATGGTTMLVDNVRVSPRMGVQTTDDYKEYLEQIKDIEQGMMKEAKELWGLKYRTRLRLINQTPVVSLDFVNNEIGGDYAGTLLAPVRDDKLIANHITVHRKTGSRVTVTQDQGNLTTQLPPKGVGKWAKQAKVIAAEDAQLLALAAHLLDIGSTGSNNRYPQIPVDLARSAVANKFALIAQVEIGDFIQLTNLPFWYPESTAKQLVIGYTEIIGNFQWDIIWNGTPETPYEIQAINVRRW